MNNWTIKSSRKSKQTNPQKGIGAQLLQVMQFCVYGLVLCFMVSCIYVISGMHEMGAQEMQNELAE